MLGDTWEYTSLHRAARNNENPAVIETLLQAGAESNARDLWKYTPLHLAARFSDNAAVIEALLKGGAKLKARDGDKNTPLHEAARFNDNVAVIEVLLKAGANLKARNRGGATPLSLANEHNKNPAVRQVLLAVGDGRVGKQMAATRERKKSQSASGGWAALVAGVTGAAIGAAGGLDAATATELGTAIGGSVLAGEAGGGTGGGYSPTPTGADGSSSEFDTALRNMENSCGERYRSGFSDQDHGRFLLSGRFCPALCPQEGTQPAAARCPEARLRGVAESGPWSPGAPTSACWVRPAHLEVKGKQLIELKKSQGKLDKKSNGA